MTVDLKTCRLLKTLVTKCVSPVLLKSIRYWESSSVNHSLHFHLNVHCVLLKACLIPATVQNIF